MELYQLAKQTEPNDFVRWQGESGKARNPEQRTVKKVILEIGRVTIEAEEGPEDGKTKFEVSHDGQSQVTYGGRSQGPVDWVVNDTKEIYSGANAPNPPE